LERVGYGVRTDGERTAKKVTGRQSNKKEIKKSKPRLRWVGGWLRSNWT
jgi:hypothetical protein